MASSAGWKLVIRGNGTELGETPLIVELGKTALPPDLYLLKRESDGHDLAASVFEDSGKLFLATVLDRAQARGMESYALSGEAGPDAGSRGIELRSEGAKTRVSFNGSFVTEYLHGADPKPYLYPVVGPSGAEFTRSYPMKMVEGEDRDHPHQRSFWFTHGKVNGVDFWSELTRHGSIKENSSRIVVAQGPVGEIKSANVWRGPDGKEICEDERVIRFYATTRARVIDFDIVIRATSGPVTFGDTKEGMFGLRVASSMDVKRKQGGKITNAEGVTDLEAWGKASPWVDYTGPIEGKAVGIAILNHPESFRYPTTWHVRDYGLFAANPFGWHDFGRSESGDYTVPSGGSISFRYRVILHMGDTASASLPAAFKGYSKPPKAELVGG
jgi:hypothetical protein